ncbi:hypothetical protein C6P40_004749 [Pichia californica]|uniref:NAD-dependent epimerase/dehydratase domain-containing protein n=1 Tax=Pichia californica TaxID=460514 RepID=A0A9P7BII2_9ASCO|nr:hypothetical protein C6P42_004081 [[Candida] californica]KAG0691143.1 hypothetical protein C6P40_004749 [[Candida] californica]
MAQSTVLVTGVTGFIAHYIVDKLLARKYGVIGTVRSETKGKNIVGKFKELYPDADFTYEIVPDIATPNAFDEVMKKHTEILYVIHTASPVTYDKTKSYEIGYLKPALDGTLNILHAIKKYSPQVTNVVLTSSFAAVRQQGDLYHTAIHTKDSWNPIKWEDVKTEGNAYSASKTAAEKAARKFYEDEKPKYKLATVNPPFVLGPQFFVESVAKSLNYSNDMLSRITGIDPSTTGPLSSCAFLAIHVKDIAEFHILPLENKELASERIFVAASPIIAQKVLNILNDNFPELDGKIAKGDYDSADSLMAKFCPKYDISSTLEKVGGYEFIGLEESVVSVYKQYLSIFNID